ncbi:MAG: response regulator [Planctomycetota bacterium]|nr:MAG: response regulator [Planctomycetota bacterium]
MLHILLIEDDDDQAEICSYHLEQTAVEHRVSRASDGERALELLRKATDDDAASLPDLILLDLNLPRINGHEVLRRIKEHERLRSIPVVVLTSSSSAQDRALAHDNHANSYLVKPMGFDDYGELMSTLSTYWNLCQDDRPRDMPRAS